MYIYIHIIVYMLYIVCIYICILWNIMRDHEVGNGVCVYILYI